MVDLDRRAEVQLALRHPLRLARGDHLLELLRQPEGAHPRPHGRRLDADPLRQAVPALVLVREAAAQLAAQLGLLDRREVLPLDVLDQVDLHDLVVGVLPHDDRHGIQPGLLGRPVAPLAHHDLVVRVGRPHQDRLEDAELPDARSHRVHGRVVHPGVARVRGDRSS